MLIFRLSKTHEIEAINLLIEKARKIMNQRGIDQWQKGVPNQSMVEQDVAMNESYVLLDDGILVGSAMVSIRHESTYDEIEGSWSTSGPYTVVHRFVVDTDKHQQGYASRMLQEIEIRCQYDSIRIDTHHDNHAMRKLLEKNGYRLCGNIRLNDGSPRVAYDKIVKN